MIRMPYYIYKTKYGPVYIKDAENAIIHIKILSGTKPGSVSNRLPSDRYMQYWDTDVKEETPLIRKTYRQICDYFDSERKTFTIPIDLFSLKKNKKPHTTFQMKVLESVMNIPYGCTKTYQEIAAEIHSDEKDKKRLAARAVGNVVSQNPILILVPCHRVVRKDGIGNYAGGSKMKSDLLDMESKMIRQISEESCYLNHGV